MLDDVLRERIREWASDHGAVLTDDEVEYALRGVRHWFDSTVDDSISTAVEIAMDELR